MLAGGREMRGRFAGAFASGLPEIAIQKQILLPAIPKHDIRQFSCSCATSLFRRIDVKEILQIACRILENGREGK
jgi:hypothetical protein